MDESTNTPNTKSPKELLPLLPELTPEVHKTLVDPYDLVSYRSFVIMARQAKRRADDNSPYIIQYYVHEKATDPVLPIFEKHGYIPSPIKPINTQMQASIDTSLATLTQQLPGRFIFKRVTNPDDAEIYFAGIEKLAVYKRDDQGRDLFDKDGNRQMQSYEGSASIHGVILLPEKSFSGPLTSLMPSTTLHEVEHALGFKHPHAQGENVAHKVSLFDTVMTYDTENNGASTPLPWQHIGQPIGLMPADLIAAAKLYPLASDRSQPALGMPAEIYTDRTKLKVMLTNEAGSTREIAFPDRGVVYQPITDSKVDTLVLAGAMPPMSIAERDAADAERGLPFARVDMLPSGVVISQPSMQGSVYLPVRPETLVLAPNMATEVHVAGHSHVVIPPSNPTEIIPDRYNQTVYVRGEGNHITMDARNLKTGAVNILIAPGGHAQVRIENAALLLKERSKQWFLDIQPDLTLGAQEAPDAAASKVRWRKDGEHYRIDVSPLDAGRFEPIRVTLSLNSQEPMLHAQFQALLNQGLLVVGEPRVSLTSDTGARVMTPTQVDEAGNAVSTLPPKPPRPIGR